MREEKIPETQVDILIRNAAIVTMDEENTVINDGVLAIKDGEIIAMGSGAAFARDFKAAETLDGTDRVAMPGLIDTHFHTAQQFERNILNYVFQHRGLKDPVWQYFLIPFEAALTDEDLHLSAMFAYSNLLKVGTTCFADAGGPKPEMMAPALETTGIRGILARSTIDLKENIPPEMTDTVTGVIDKGRSLHREWNGKADGRIRTWMGMRQIMICSEELMRAIKETADDLNTGIHIHLAENTSEIEYTYAAAGLRPPEYLESIGFLSRNVHAAHSVFLSEGDLALYKEYDISIAHCPVVAYQDMGVTRLPDMIRLGLRVGLGTDGALSSGGSLDLFRQISVAHNIQVSTFGLPYRDLAPITTGDLLRMATIGGAKALNWDDEIGSLEVGKKADIILLARDDLDVLPSWDPLLTVATPPAASQVKTVLVNGEVVLRDGELVNVDEEALKAKVKERAPKILEHFLKRVDS